MYVSVARGGCHGPKLRVDFFLRYRGEATCCDKPMLVVERGITQTLVEQHTTVTNTADMGGEQVLKASLVVPATQYARVLSTPARSYDATVRNSA